MSQVGWKIWNKKLCFPSMKQMKEKVISIVESTTRGGPDGVTTMVCWYETKDGYCLESITDWQNSVISQVEYPADYNFTPLEILLLGLVIS
jgi:hypothetical protein